MDDSDSERIASSLGASSSQSDITSLTMPQLLAKAQQVTGQGLDRLVTAKDMQALAEALVLLGRLEQQVEAQGLFSANEDQDDIATGDLKYLLAPFWSAELHSNFPVPSGRPAQRGKHVAAALAAYQRFLSRVEQYKLMGQLGQQLMRNYEQAATAGGRLDPATKRTAKMERFKRDKAIRSQLEQLEQQRGGGRAAEDGEEAGPLGGCGALDEEDERRLWQLRLEAAALQALEQRQLLKEEEALLRHAVQAGVADGDEEEAREQRQREQRAMMEQLAKVAGSLAGSGPGRREELRQGVFRPGHALPTMTVEEFGRLELEDVRRREQAEAVVRAQQQRQEAEARSDEEDDAALRKQRAWDDWKDDHPYGEGNRALKNTR